jgi:O-acetylserine/cysteine efflux transporter
MPFTHIFLACLVAMAWGCNFIVVKLGVYEVPPLLLCSLRFFFASIPAVFFIRWPNTTIKMVTLYGLIMFALQFAFVFTGMAVGMTPGIASLIGQTQIFFSVFFAMIFLRETLTFLQILSSLIAFSGIGIAAMHVDNIHISLLGLLLILGSAATLGLGNLITKKLSHVNMISLIVWGNLVAFVPMSLLSFMIYGGNQINDTIHHLSWLSIFSIAYIVCVSTWLGYGLWSWLLSRHPVSTVVPFTLLVPVFAMVGSALVTGEHFEPWKILVAVLIMLGLCINLFAPRFSPKKQAIALQNEI